MKKISYLAILSVLLLFTFCKSSKFKVEKFTDKNGYSYEMITNDPAGARIYKLKNGLTVYLSVNKDEPRVQTYIAVRAGSTYDPKETTGLAHYLEHMMFKGTSKFGTSDWEKESKLLDEISQLFEAHKNATSPEDKKRIYTKIDSVSLLAANYAVPSEYDKMMSSIGAKGTNAWTSHEETVYVNDIPVNELEKWLTLEKERFSKLVLRLFHTELEAVYEEFNMGQDNDWRKSYNAMMQGLFKKHPYGTQTTLGLGEHLKNPSMVNIHNYWNTYYVPNNMAICLSGDIDPEATIKMIDATWGTFQSKDVPKKDQPVEEPITKPESITVVGPDAENLTIAYRTDGFNTQDRAYATLLSKILYNGTAGLMDIDLNQKQKVLESYAYASFMKNYGVFQVHASPRQGQKLEEAKDLLLAEIEKVKKGDFENWLIEAAINDLKVSLLRRQEQNENRAYQFVESFRNFNEWIDYVRFVDDISKISKKELIEFANRLCNENYVAVYKRVGKDTSVFKVEKPKITNVPMNRDAKSEFYKTFEKMQPANLNPVFVDFQKEIAKKEIVAGVEFNYLKNETNDLFTLYYVFDMGKDNNLKLPIAIDYLPFVGTDKYTPEQLQQEFYKLGIRFWVNAGSERSYVYISGLQSSYKAGIELLEHLLANAKGNEKSYKDYIDGVLKKRADAKLDKDVILWDALYNYGQFGSNSPYTNILQEQDLRGMKPGDLTNLIKELASFKHRILYYGQADFDDAFKVVKDKHALASQINDVPTPVKFAESDFGKSMVYWVNYDMVQNQMMMISKDKDFNIKLIPDVRLFSEYFGGGLSSIIFQEIRESRALAYSAFAAYRMPDKLDKSPYVFGYVATQADKLKSATDAMLALLNDMPKAQIQFDASRDALMKRIESERITNTNIFFTYLNNLDRGINYDIRKDVYERMKTVKMDELSKFFDAHVKGKKYTYLIIGKKENIDVKALSQFGEVKELTLKDVFNY